MLKNLTANPEEIKRREQVAIAHGFQKYYIPQGDKKLLLEDGIYRCANDFNFAFDEFIETNSEDNYRMQYFIYAPTFYKNDHGVADNIEQIKEYYKEEIEDPTIQYFIYVTPVFQDKKNKGKGGGWRWHKWGSYIGKFEPQCEYLDDENFGPDFKYVLCFHIVKVKVLDKVVKPELQKIFEEYSKIEKDPEDKYTKFWKHVVDEYEYEQFRSVAKGFGYDSYQLFWDHVLKLQESLGEKLF